MSYRHLEQMVKDMLVYPKKAIGLPERGHCPHDLSRWSFLGNLSGEGGKGPEQKPQEVYTGWGWGRGLSPPFSNSTHTFNTFLWGF